MKELKELGITGITALRKKVKELSLEIAVVKRDSKSNFRVIEARAALDAAQNAYSAACRIAEAEATKDLQEELDAVTALVRAHDESNKKPALVTPVHILDLLARCRRGVDYGPKPFVILWVSPTGRFFVVTNQGHYYWSGIGRMAYGKSDHYLMDCAGEVQSHTKHGHDIWSAIKVEGCSSEGRLLKATKEAWIDKALEIEGREPDAWQIPVPEPEPKVEPDMSHLKPAGSLDGFEL